MVEFHFPENAPLAAAAEAAMQAFEGEQRKLTELQQKVDDDSTTVRSKDRSLSMTFDGRGDLTAMKFLGTKYRTMAPAELAHLIVETVQAGRAQCMEKLVESMSGYGGLPGINFGDLVAGRMDPGKLVESLFSPFADKVDEEKGGSRPVKESEK
ncbi:YbaB/EbfC family nucleoid-associated protein [Amycolatopsis sp. NPDC049868]|uniref:YbaB/EbfC family nucleoid-associated protein n=1 Tax=Amycolatopsis sp. NPDC049868 TaxID=3363934 RepID=UPI0037B6F54C